MPFVLPYFAGAAAAALAAASLPELIAALAILLALWALGLLLIRPLQILLGYVPVIGTQLADNLGRGVGVVGAWALGWARTGSEAISGLILGPVSAVIGFVGQLVSLVETLTVTVPKLWDAIAAGTGALFAQVRTIAGQAATALARIATLFAVTATLTARLGAVIATTIPRAIATAVDAAKAFASALVAAEAALVRAADASLERLIMGQVGVLSAAIAAAVATVRAETLPRIGHLESEVGQVIAQVTPLVAAGLIARTLTLERTLTKTIEDCVDPTCAGVTPNLNWLNLLGDTALFAAVLGLVGEAIRDPAGTARVIVDLTDGAKGAAEGLIDPLLGVQL